jgi:(2Fe-2S) ferredoxin
MQKALHKPCGQILREKDIFVSKSLCNIAKIQTEIYMEPKYKRYIFVCTNERAAEHPRGSCAARGANEVLDALKNELRAKNLNLEIRANKCGCMDICESGPNLLISPDNKWYHQVSVDQVKGIVEELAS